MLTFENNTILSCNISYTLPFSSHILRDVCVYFRWHSHAGLQYVDGVHGPLIVRQPNKTNVNRKEYHFDLSEHIIYLQDWFHIPMVNVLVPEFYHGAGPYTPDAILINGRGGQIVPEHHKPQWCEDGSPCSIPRYAQFNVSKGQKYRFRTIAGMAARKCSVRVSIDNHNLVIIATDGAPTKPFTCKSFRIFNAERYDFVLDANQAHGNYWLRVEVSNILFNFIPHKHRHLPPHTP